MYQSWVEGINKSGEQVAGASLQEGRGVDPQEVEPGQLAEDHYDGEQEAVELAPGNKFRVAKFNKYYVTHRWTEEKNTK